MADPREVQLQRDVVDALCANGWQIGQSSKYDRVNGLYPEDLVGFFESAYPERWERFSRNNPGDPERALVVSISRELSKSGTLSLLRRGFKVPGVEINVAAFEPDHSMNPDTAARFALNRLRVVPELSYSPHAVEGAYNPRLDLVLFVNGVATATLELKSEFKQAVDNAKRQYMYDRPVRDPKTRKVEPLLEFKRGALVHFAVSQFEVAMTTKLAGKNTVFLPFNRGTPDGGAGNPLPESENDYATSYLWEQVLRPQSWLHILQRFVHLEVKQVEDFHGRRSTRETMIFPRYHQLDVVNKLIACTRSEGPGKRYLVQHSAGSGKSNSIAWAAHQLASLYDSHNERVFDSVIVVTDRTVLDRQLRDTIYQFEHKAGVVEPITEDSSGSKSQQLADALAAKTRIITVTLQTFPALYEALDKRPDLAGGKYAVIADEAHSSQSGASANKLKALLASDTPEGEEVSAEEFLDAAVAARRPTESISYYAFTATPKAKTLELFGRPPGPTSPISSENVPEAFHVYSMRQAIEEGFILDVLQRYVSYQTAYRLAHPQADVEVDSKEAKKSLAKWVRLHPHNIDQKVQIIVEHFRDHVKHLLDGQAKAMVVTGSRQEAVRYHLAMRKYVDEQGIDDVLPVVAFSGTVPPDGVIPEEVTEFSKSLNPNLAGRDIAEAFDTMDYNVLIVANKYQTGFDQPKLCAMYVDKKLKGVDCVQTLSRLNRIFPGKETFILDFVNEPEEVLEAFRPYYNKAELADVSDQQVVYDLQRKLDDEQIYHWEEVEAFAAAFYDPKGSAAQLANACHPAKERFGHRYRAAVQARRMHADALQHAEVAGDATRIQQAEHDLKEAGEAIDQLDLFRKNLRSFVRAYEFLSQIVEYDDRTLEQLNVYAAHLYPLLRMDPMDQDKIDLSELQLSHYRLTKQAEGSLTLDGGDAEGLRPITSVGSGTAHDAEKLLLAEIIEALNELFGAEVHDDDKLHYATGIADVIRRDEEVMVEVRNHPPQQIMHGLLPKRLNDAVLDSMANHQKLATEILNDNQKSVEFARLIIRLLVAK